ncbi:MAG: protein kinase, partial [Candidatus Neomarinimicrobiota bacterium]
MVGTTISHYKVLEKIGEGGMGEVYRATDTKLNRDVALKILPERFASDSQRMGRFQREAEVLASLDHPNIGQIYGIEDAGQTKALVLQLIEGPTLADKIAQGPIPVEEALKIALQMAEGLEAAHEKGVIHRDLKPANIKITPEGQVKILDFGLAKALEGETPADTDLSQSPTLTAAATQTGVILGTAAYMSPEQAKGKAVDKRADIFAFGAVLYECLTGKKAFEGDTITETIAAVLKSEPDWETLPKNTPRTTRTLLRRCLHKELDRRLQHIGDGRIEIEEALATPAQEISAGTTTMFAPRGWRQVMPWGLALLIFGVFLGVIAVLSLTPVTSQPARPITRFAMHLSPDQELQGGDWSSFALSTDGAQLVYVATAGVGVWQLYLRHMDSLEASRISGTEGARSPFFSPDGQWIGFFADAKLKKVSTSGGAPLTLCAAPQAKGGSWGPNDTIVFTATGTSGLSQVSAAGGTPQVLTTPDSQEGEVAHTWPKVLPGGKAVLFSVRTVSRTMNDALIVAQEFETGERRVLVEGGTHPHYAPTGHLVYTRASTLLAMPFDVDRLEVTGSPVPVLEGVQVIRDDFAQFTFASDGSLVFLPGGVPAERRLVWVDRQGRFEPLAAPPRNYLPPRISPDGRQLAVTIAEDSSDVWVYDMIRHTLTRLTFEGINNLPLWTPDGKRVTFSSTRAGSTNLFWKPADGSGAAERLTTSEYTQIPQSWSPDGQVLGFHELHPITNWDIWVLPLEGERK